MTQEPEAVTITGSLGKFLNYGASQLAIAAEIIPSLHKKTPNPSLLQFLPEPSVRTACLYTEMLSLE